MGMVIAFCCASEVVCGAPCTCRELACEHAWSPSSRRASTFHPAPYLASPPWHARRPQIIYFFPKHTRLTCVICLSAFRYLPNNTVGIVVCFRRHFLPSLLLLPMPATNFCSFHSDVLHPCTSEFPSPVCLVGEVRPGPEATDRAVSHSL